MIRRVASCACRVCGGPVSTVECPCEDDAVYMTIDVMAIRIVAYTHRRSASALRRAGVSRDPRHRQPRGGPRPTRGRATGRLMSVRILTSIAHKPARRRGLTSLIKGLSAARLSPSALRTPSASSATASAFLVSNACLRVGASAHIKFRFVPRFFLGPGAGLRPAPGPFCQWVGQGMAT